MTPVFRLSENSPLPFNLREGDIIERFVVGDSESVELVVHPAFYLSNELLVSLFARLNTDEPFPSLLVCSPFHPIQNRSSPFYVHVAGAFAWRMPSLFYRVCPKPSGESG